MAATYILMCRECRQYLSLGKLHFTESPISGDSRPAIQGIYDDRDRQWHIGDKVFSDCLAIFLIVHRNHTLMFVPEGVDELIEESDMGAMFDTMEPSILEANASSVEFDAEAELERWRQNL